MIKASIKTLKFPYVFWFFNQAYPCAIDIEQGIYKNLEKKTDYKIKELNKIYFLALKYLPILILFYFSFSIYDFIPNKINLLEFLFALFLTLAVNMLENLARKIAVGAILIFTLFVGFYLDESFFVCAYVLKYFILFSALLLFVLDSKVRAFLLLKNNQVVSGFCLDKENLGESQKNNLIYKVEGAE